MLIIAADHVLPISSSPISNGAVAIEGRTVLAVDSYKEVIRVYPEAAVVQYGTAAVLPGFVNCHSHLEVTGLRGALDDVEHDFTAWLLRLNALRAARSEDEIKDAAILGAIEGARSGVTCFGDIGRLGSAGVQALKSVGLRGIVYQETEFSPEVGTADADFQKLGEKYESLRADETELVKIGISPHSPFTVSSRLFELIAEYSILNRIPIAVHVSESADEQELLTKGTGFFTSVYEKYGVEWHSPMCTPIEYLERLGVLAAKPLLVHCVTADDSDLEKVGSTRSTIAHCPKSNAKFGHGYAPFERMLDIGIAVGFGSDSVASNNLCDIIEEGRFAGLAARNRNGSKRFITAKEILQTLTLGGAQAMGLDDLIGTLEPGKQADLAVISLVEPSLQPLNDIESALVYSSSGRDAVATYVAGNLVWKKNGVNFSADATLKESSTG